MNQVDLTHIASIHCKSNRQVNADAQRMMKTMSRTRSKLAWQSCLVTTTPHACPSLRFTQSGRGQVLTRGVFYFFVAGNPRFRRTVTAKDYPRRTEYSRMLLAARFDGAFRRSLRHSKLQSDLVFACAAPSEVDRSRTLFGRSCVVLRWLMHLPRAWLRHPAWQLTIERQADH